MLKSFYNLKKTLVQIYELKNSFFEKNISCYLEMINNSKKITLKIINPATRSAISG